MTELESYYKEIMSNVSRLAEANEDHSEAMFFENRMKILIEDGHSVEYEDEDDKKKKSTKSDEIQGGYKYTYLRQTGLRVDGYEFLIDRSTLILYICHFVQSNEINTLTRTEITQFLKNTGRFYEKSLDKSYLNSLEETSDGYEVASFINKNHKSIDQIGVRIVTNCLLSARVKNTILNEEEQFLDQPTTLDIWDIQRFYDNEDTGGKSELLEIDFLSEFNSGLPALPVSLDSTSYKSFLCVIPGAYLAKLYSKYGSRLLEANVRSFLQFKGAVNKGMRDTLKDDPHMFFAYNNGITATAEEFRVNEKNEITYLKNLQIVNGGQTTASLCITNSKNSEVTLDHVFVQMKLSIVDTKTSEEIVPNIAKFANTQNKINPSDFFSNHPFHRKMEKKSRQISTPIVSGQIRSSKWFYEHSRGSYDNEKKKGSKSDERAFLLEYPVHQKMDKLSLAKTAVIFDGDPHQAVKGQQSMFKHFASNIQTRWEKNSFEFNDDFYKKIVAQQILFRDGRVIVMKQVTGQAIQPVLAYSLYALNALSMSKHYGGIFFKSAWDNQGIDDVTSTELVKVIDFVYGYFEKFIANNEGKTILSVSKNNPFFQGFKAKVGSESMNNFLSIEYKKSLPFKAVKY